MSEGYTWPYVCTKKEIKKLTTEKLEKNIYKEMVGYHTFHFVEISVVFAAHKFYFF